MKSIINQTLGEYLDGMKGKIEKTLPKIGMSADRFISMVKSAATENPALLKCTPCSLKAAVMKCAEMGLEPNSPLGQCYLIPRKNKTGETECTFQMGYHGILALAHRTGKIQMAYADKICRNDEYDYRKGLGAYIEHKPCIDGPRGDAIAYYAVYQGTDGSYGFEIMSVDEIRAHAAKYCNMNSGAWRGNFDEMAKKTVMMRLSDYMPMSADIQREIAEERRIMPAEKAYSFALSESDDSAFLEEGPQEFPDYESGDDFPEYEAAN